jgi:hypothetical protein
VVVTAALAMATITPPILLATVSTTAVEPAAATSNLLTQPTETAVPLARIVMVQLITQCAITC